VLTFRLADAVPAPERLLLLGAHADDIEIGCGGTVLKLLADHPRLLVTWVVLSASAERAREAVESAHALLGGSVEKEVVVKRFRDGFFPWEGGPIKEFFEELKATVAPDLVFTPSRLDRHQDHRLVAELTWNTFRDHLILEYEIPKYEGDFGHPNFFVPLEAPVAHRKARHIFEYFPSQRGRRWFAEDLFLACLRLRGLEANAPSGYAEGFHCAKVSIR
jgi:LmbE family N-acetylglucosaminyl deacetylase